jgi:hypothetical protein
MLSAEEETGLKQELSVSRINQPENITVIALFESRHLDGQIDSSKF